MTDTGPGPDGLELMKKILKEKDGLQLPKYHGLASSLGRAGFIVCRRSDNDTETWWLTDQGKDWL